METKVRRRDSQEPIDFGAFHVVASLSVGIGDLPESLQTAVFAQDREGLGPWHFVDLNTPVGRVLIGQAQGMPICASLWCEKDLAPNEIVKFCGELFRTTVRVMNPDTGDTQETSR